MSMTPPRASASRVGWSRSSMVIVVPSDFAKFLEELSEERTAPEPDGQQTAEEQHGVDTLAPLFRPVHILEIEPERELIEGERGGASVEHRVELRESIIGVAGRVLAMDHPQVAASQQARDPEHEVMEMAP